MDEATSAADALSLVGTTAYDCMVLDYFLPDATALSLVPRIQAAASELPVVMLTGQGDEEIAIQLIYRRRLSDKPSRPEAIRKILAEYFRKGS